MFGAPFSLSIALRTAGLEPVGYAEVDALVCVVGLLVKKGSYYLGLIGYVLAFDALNCIALHVGACFVSLNQQERTD